MQLEDRKKRRVLSKCTEYMGALCRIIGYGWRGLGMWRTWRIKAGNKKNGNQGSGMGGRGGTGLGRAMSVYFSTLRWRYLLCFCVSWNFVFYFRFRISYLVTCVLFSQVVVYVLYYYSLILIRVVPILP